MAEKKTYGPKEVSKLTGLSRRQLNYWKLIGVVKPRRENHRTRTFYRYTERDLETLQALRKLTENGYLVSKAAERIKAVLEQSGNHPVDLLSVIESSSTPQMVAMSYFRQRLREEFERARRFGHPLSCLAIKIAGFEAGDTRPLLGKIERTLLVSKRQYDVVGQVDLDEFLWLMPQTGEAGAKAAAERIRRYLLEQGLPEEVTIHIGTATIQSGSGSPESLIDQARRAHSGPEGQIKKG